MNAVTPFAFEDHLVRIVTRDGEPWFVANDVCRALGLVNPRKATGDLAEDEKGVTTGDTPGGVQEMVVISEPGVYRLVFTSRKPEAERFKRWLAHDVLPAIRRTGGYAIPTTEGDDGADDDDLDPEFAALDTDVGPLAVMGHKIRLVSLANKIRGADAARDLWSRLGLPKLAEAPEQAEKASNVTRIAEFVAEHGVVARSMVCRRFIGGMTAGEISSALAVLEADGRVTRTRKRIGRRGKPTEFIAAAEPRI